MHGPIHGGVPTPVRGRCLWGMRRRHGPREIEWPVTFYVTDGRLFTVEAPRGTAVEALCRVRVMGDEGSEERDAPLGVMPSSGAVIGRTLRWWRHSTGQPVAISPRRLQES